MPMKMACWRFCLLTMFVLVDERTSGEGRGAADVTLKERRAGCASAQPCRESLLKAVY